MAKKSQTLRTSTGTNAATAFEYSTRCYLDRTIEGVGSANESITEFEFDCDGNLSRIWDANHPSAGRTQAATTVYAYDSRDRLTSVTQPWGGTGDGDVVTSYGYDVQDHLVEVIDGEDNVTSYSYSDRDLLTQEISEVTGTANHVYNAHGELTQTTDARGVTVFRTIDALDRVTFVDYPGSALDIARTYDDPAVPFSLGRLTRIERDGHDIELAYDRFGRLSQDGALLFVFDKNGNRTQITFPGGIAATYAYDFADRQASLDVSLPGQAAQSIVTSASYYPSGPLRTLTLGNGLAEDRAHDSRYHPAGITVSGAGTQLDWDYTTDGVGNPTSIADVLNTVNNRTYGYQDIQYFLTQGDGPWGARAWTYDRIGNRLTEVRDSQPADVYQYPVNGAGGNSPKLTSITLGAGGTRSYVYDAAGNATDITQGTETLEREYDDASRLALIRRPEDFETTFAYDGRDFLRETERTSLAFFADGFESGNAACWSSVVGGPTGGTCSAMSPPTDLSFPQLDSSGVIHGLNTASATRTVLYFNGLPAAIVAGSTVLHLTVDHLGAPILATQSGGAVTWSGGLAPFGEDYANASGAGIFLRFPGQVDDATWAGGLDEPYYNVYRWYVPEVGRYSRADPLGILPPERSQLNLYAYAVANPMRSFDPLGLDAVTDDPRIQQCILCIFQRAGYGAKNSEEALWVTCDGENGDERDCILWPSTANQGNSTRSNTTYRGTVPRNACGLVHTHPRRKPAPPSTCNGCDTSVSEAYGIPIYTVHPTGLWKYDPDTNMTTQEGDSSWFDDAREQCGKKPCKGLRQ